MDSIFIPTWAAYLTVYLLIGIVWALISSINNWEVELDFDYMRLWPFYLFFWLPMIIFIVIGFSIFAVIVTIKDTFIPFFRRNIRQHKYRKEVRKYRPKYGYDK